MTVKDAIKRLQELPEDLELGITGCGDCFDAMADRIAVTDVWINGDSYTVAVLAVKE